MNSLQELFNTIAQHDINIAQQVIAILQSRNDQFHYNLFHDVAYVRLMLAKLNNLTEQRFSLATNYPLAVESNDHHFPWGTKNDNTRCPRFVKASESLFPGKRLSYLDMGCSGGGVVFDFLVAGHDAFGLEGSDFSMKTQRAEWRIIPNALKTADITKSFEITKCETKSQAQFDVITMWEVLEHIPELALPSLLSNIKRHLANDGVFVGSVALQDDIVNGVSYHPTVKPKNWWHEKFREHDFEVFEYELLSAADHCRGTGNGPLDPNFQQNPEKGFHITLKHRKHN